MPGMAANSSIFEYVKLPESTFTAHFLEWEIPQKGESLQEYAWRMCQKISAENPVLIGVSFGGVLVQEMAKLIHVKKVIIISSIKCNGELPVKMQFAKYTKAYKLLPTRLAKNLHILAKYAFGETVKKRVALYQKYLSVTDKFYYDWALEQLINWKQKEPPPGIIHIHGEKDPVFPSKKLSNYIEIKGGTHVAIIQKYQWFNENLPKLILS